MNSYARLGIFGILALVALRVGIGWHFYMEGATKVRGNDFSSVGFLNAAKGPLADKFQSLIWDHDGQVRLDRKRVPRLLKPVLRMPRSTLRLRMNKLRNLQRCHQAIFREAEEKSMQTARDDIYQVTSGARTHRQDGNPGCITWQSMRGQKEKIQNRTASERETNHGCRGSNLESI